MRYRTHLKKTILLATPVVMSQLGHIMVSVADSAMVGQVGPIPLAGSALAGSFLHLAMLFGIGVSYGVTPLVAAAHGAEDRTKLGVIFKHGLVINTLTGLILATVVLLIAPLLGFLGQDQSVVDEAIPYLQITAMSIFPLMVFQHFRQFLEGLATTHQAMIISILANLLNVGMNYVFIFGKFGFEPMGLYGAGLATLISRVILAMSIAIYFLNKNKWRFIWSNYFNVKWSSNEAKSVISIGLPSGLQLVFEVGAFAFSNIMAGWIGAKYLAAHQIVLNISGVTYMAATGISASATIRVGNFFGKQNWYDLRKAGYVCMICIAFFMATCCVLLIFGRHTIPGWYVNDQEVITLAAPIFVMVAFYQLSDGLQVVGLGALRGISDVKVPTFVTLIAYWLIAIPCGYLVAFVFDYGLIGIWVGLLVGLTVAAVLHVWRFQHLTSKYLSAQAAG